MLTRAIAEPVELEHKLEKGGPGATYGNGSVAKVRPYLLGGSCAYPLAVVGSSNIACCSQSAVCSNGRCWPRVVGRAPLPCQHGCEFTSCTLYLLTAQGLSRWQWRRES